MSISRREAILGVALFPFLPSLAEREPGDAVSGLRGLERASGGRLGVAIRDLESGRSIALRAGERFPMCSTFKLLAVAAVLARVDRGEERLDRSVPFTKADLLEYAPVTTARVSEGNLTLGELCDAAMTLSDNTAANLILKVLGGPGAITAYARTLGDTETRLDRTEPQLNEAQPGDPRDTTTPASMVGNLQRLLVDDALSNRSRATLTAWLVGNRTGHARLRAGIPRDWRIGEKTGTGQHGSTNDIGIIWPPRRRPILVAAYLAESSVSNAEREATLAGVARVIASGI